MPKTIVFLGPSLNLKEAESILPDAHFLPPVKCGDVLRVLRLKPEIIVIIDGYFERTAAVWHKEILFALESGCKVYGAASMGALRAAELAPFGMQGCGYIYSLYANGSLIDDDEVAVLHGPVLSNYAVNSEAMVNIRATVAAALEREIITAMEAIAIIKLAKALPYQERNLKKILSSTVPAKVALLLENFVDQKKLDAIAVLQQVGISQSQPKNDKKSLQHTVFLRTLHNDVMCRPFPANISWLPETEKVAAITRLLGDSYRYLRRLAYLWSAVYAIATQHTEQQAVANFGDVTLATIITNVPESLSAADKSNFQIRLQTVANYLASQEDLEIAKELSVETILWDLIKLAGDYPHYKNNLEQLKAELPEYYKLLYFTAVLWRAVEIAAAQHALTPKTVQVQTFFNQFRLQYKLLSQEATEKWLADNDYTMATLSQLMLRLVRLRFLVMESNLDSLGVLQECHDTWWYFDVLCLTDFYTIGKKMLIDPNFKLAMHQKYSAKNPIKNDTDAFALDFLGGYAEFQMQL